jgi:hypothetical protein
LHRWRAENALGFADTAAEGAVGVDEAGALGVFSGETQPPADRLSEEIGVCGGSSGSDVRVRAAAPGVADRDAGVGEFIVRDDAANVPVEQALAQIDTLTATVLPRLAP